VKVKTVRFNAKITAELEIVVVGPITITDLRDESRVITRGLEDLKVTPYIKLQTGAEFKRQKE
jgi:hypothetical protein